MPRRSPTPNERWPTREWIFRSTFGHYRGRDRVFAHWALADGIFAHGIFSLGLMALVTARSALVRSGSIASFRRWACGVRFTPNTGHLVVPILPIARQRLGLFEQFPSRIPRRDCSLKFLQIGFEKGVGDDQRLDRLASITAASRDGLIGCRLLLVGVRLWLGR